MSYFTEEHMPKLTLAGHPLHPMLIVAPAALIPFGFILDAMARSTDNDDYANAAYYSLTGGLIGGLAAGVAGAMDYVEIESETEVKRTANVHAILNGGALALTAANVVMRRDEYKHGGTGATLAMGAIAALGVLVSGWFGGKLVYEQGMRVKGVSPIGDAPDVKMLPADERVEHAMHGVERHMPSAGPMMH
jgi:uncharacterized membrane protein